LMFAKLLDHSGEIQICFMKDMLQFHTGKELVQSIVIE
jgi:hypothetical protein